MNLFSKDSIITMKHCSCTVTCTDNANEVERLRAASKRERERADDLQTEVGRLRGHLDSARYTMTMQAREIERLRAIVAQDARETATHFDMLNEKDAEIERLRAAFRAIIDVEGDVDVPALIGKLARRALTPPHKAD